MKTAVFLFPNLAGHLNPTIQIAKQMQKLELEVYYCGTIDLLAFSRKNGFKHYNLSSIPFASGMDGMIDGDRQDKWLESLVDRFTNRIYKTRKEDINRLVHSLKPDVVFLDEFNISDFILLKSIVKPTTRIIVLHCKFSQYFSEIVPPLNVFEQPGTEAKKHWRKYFLNRNTNWFFDKVKYLGKNNLNILREKLKEQNLSEQYQININKVFRPSITNIEEWYMVPQELEFEEITTTRSQKYIGSMVNFERQENLEPKYVSFIEKFEKLSENKLIYVSLGSVADQHLKQKEHLKDLFFKNITEIAAEKPTWHFVCVEKNAKIKDTENLMFLDYAPQFDLLKRASVFLTHGGNNSCVDAVICQTPMLLFPLNDKWDQNGTAARMVQKGFGLKADLETPKALLRSQIETLLSEESYQKTLKSTSDMIKQKYTEKYFKDFLTTEFLVQ